MPMISSKLGIGAVEGRVAVGFWLLDPIQKCQGQSHGVRKTLSGRVRGGKERGIAPILVVFLRLIVLTTVLGLGHLVE